MWLNLTHQAFIKYGFLSVLLASKADILFSQSIKVSRKVEKGCRPMHVIPSNFYFEIAPIFGPSIQAASQQELLRLGDCISTVKSIPKRHWRAQWQKPRQNDFFSFSNSKSDPHLDASCLAGIRQTWCTLMTRAVWVLLLCDYQLFAVGCCFFFFPPLPVVLPACDLWKISVGHAEWTCGLRWQIE